MENNNNKEDESSNSSKMDANPNPNNNNSENPNPNNDNSENPNPSSRRPFTNLSQVDADLALARTLQDQERAYMMLRMNNNSGDVDDDGSDDHESWETGSYVHDDELEGVVCDKLDDLVEVNNEKEEQEGAVCDKLDDLIQQGMDKVCLTLDAADQVVVDHGIESTSLVIKDDVVIENEVKIDTTTNNNNNNGDVKGELDDEEEEEEDESSSSSSESTSSSSSISSSDDDEEEEEDSDEDDEEDDDRKKVKGDGEMEEGEIMEEMAAWSNDDEEEEDVVKGPIRTKNEVQDLPPVPPVTVTIQPHHQTLPVGVVLSIMGAQVIVEGVENHNPLSEGSILWITESRSPLGVVDEIFGPVKNPYYIVGYNSEIEVPTAIQQGSLISFVPEFADYVLNNNNLHKKGYDASGENDEELSEELEFSDDEKEAEYKKIIKMSKRNSSEQKSGHMKKDKKSRNRDGKWKNDQQSLANSQVNGSSGGPTSGPQAISPSQVNGSSGGPTSGPQGFAPSSQTPNFNGPPLGVWPNGFPSMQPQNIGFPPNGFPSNVPFMQQNFTQQPFQNLGLPNLAPFLPQFNNSGQMFPSNFVQGVPPNFGANPAFASWPTGMPQNNFNQSQVGPPMMFQGLQGVAMPNGLQMENNGALRPPFAAANVQTSQSSDQGNGLSNCGGRQPFQRGGGRFRGGRRGRSGPQSR